jgi:hypothetical protein
MIGSPVNTFDELVCSGCKWSGAAEQAIRWRQPYEIKRGQPSWHLRADCPTCGAFLRYLPKDEPAPNTPHVDKLMLLLGRLAISRHAAVLDAWAERQVPRLTKLLDDLESSTLIPTELGRAEQTPQASHRSRASSAVVEAVQVATDNGCLCGPTLTSLSIA